MHGGLHVDLEISKMSCLKCLLLFFSTLPCLDLSIIPVVCERKFVFEFCVTIFTRYVIRKFEFLDRFSLSHNVIIRVLFCVLNGFAMS